MHTEPKFAPIETWVNLSGMTRTATYHAIGRGYLRAIKQPGGRRTLVDVENGLAWLRAQPAISLPSSRVKEQLKAAA